MDTQKIVTRLSAVVASLAFVITAGCNSKPAATTDASLTSQAQTTLSADPNLSGQSIQASAASGVVTLNGNVTSDTARAIASQDVAQIAGVKTVVNNLAINPQSAQASTVVNTQLPAPIEAAKAAKTKKPAAFIQQPAQNGPAPIVRDAPQSYSQPPVQTAPPPPPASVARNITLPAGTAIPVRITQTLDSATTQTGDKFTGAIASDIVVDGLVVLSQGTTVTGHVDEAKDATHFKGSSSLTISLSAINRRGERIDVATEPYTREGEGRARILPRK